MPVNETCVVGGPGLKTYPPVGSTTDMFGSVHVGDAPFGGLKRVLAPIWPKTDWKMRPWNMP